MSGRRLFVPGARLGGERVTLAGAEHRHLARVLRARPGDEVTLFDGDGGEVEARVVRVDRSEVELALGARRVVGGAAVALTLLCAVPRGPRMDFLVQKTAELGIARIVPIVMARSVVRPNGEAGRRGRWEKIAREAARQSGRADVPVIDAALPLDAALAAADLPARRLALFEGEQTRSLRAALGGTTPAPTALLVGPEGGFAAAELPAVEAAGFSPVGLGRRILRVETAAIVAVALCAEAYGMLG